MSTETDIRGLVRSGVWDNNIPMVQMLGLCPALAVTTSATNGLGMALATGLVLVTTNVMIACVRSLIAPDVRIPALIVLIATVVTSVDLIMNAWLHDLYKVLGIFIPLIVTNCAILGRAESFASKQPPGVAFVDGLAM